MTPAELDELERLERAATPGPWHVYASQPDVLILFDKVPKDQEPDYWKRVDKIADIDARSSGGCHEADLIVKVRNALPRLIAALREARRERDEARGLQEADHITMQRMRAKRDAALATVRELQARLDAQGRDGGGR